MLKVACATHSMSGYYTRWFKDKKVFGHENNVDHVDLLILTGGEDVHPSRYGEPINGSYGCNSERDEREINIISKALDINPNLKVFGVCRGLQIMNVFLGGDLWQDIDSIGKEHTGVHTIQHIYENPFSWLKAVNSLHHQAVKQLGSSGMSRKLLAVEPTTGIAEMVAYGNNFLGVQFHPELFGGATGDRFFSVLSDWVLGSATMYNVNDIPMFKISLPDLEANITEDWTDV